MRSACRSCVKRLGLVVVVGSLAAGGSVAVGYERVPAAYREVASEFNVPEDIVFAMALAESEIMLTSQRVMPWPWTLNVGGDSERFRNREEAWEAIQSHLEHGEDSIDIGLMQVNWHWHGQRLEDPWKALDPMFNLRVAVSILRERYEEDGDWMTAVGRYHAPADTPEAQRRAAEYRDRVRRRLERIE